MFLLLGNTRIRSSRPAAAKSSTLPYEYEVEDNSNVFAAEFPRKCKLILYCKLYSDDDYYCFYCLSNYILITLHNEISPIPGMRPQPIDAYWLLINADIHRKQDLEPICWKKDYLLFTMAEASTLWLKMYGHFQSTFLSNCTWHSTWA